MYLVLFTKIRGHVTVNSPHSGIVYYACDIRPLLATINLH